MKKLKFVAFLDLFVRIVAQAAGAVLLLLTIGANTRYLETHERNILTWQSAKIALLITIVALLIIAAEVLFTKKYCTCDEKWFLTAKAFALLATIALSFIYLSGIFGPVKTETITKTEVIQLPNDIVYIHKESNNIKLPFKTDGEQAVVIDTSLEMKDFMHSFFKDNIPFFTNSDSAVYLLKEGKLIPFDGEFDQIEFSGEAENVAEVIKNMNYQTIWLFSSVKDIDQNTEGEVAKTLIVYSNAEEINIQMLETYFKKVVGITIRDVK